MEIIHLILGKANPNRMNGVNKVVYQLATNQALENRKVAIWGVTKDPTHNYGDRNFETKLFKGYKNPFKVDSELKKELLKLSSDAVIHLHGGWVPLYGTLTKFLFQNNINYVITAHGSYNLIAMAKSGMRKKLYFNFFEKRLLQDAMKIHALGKSEVVGIQQLLPNHKTVLIPYGFEPAVVELKEKSQAKFVVGFVGRIDIHTKGLDIIIDAFRQFNDKNPDSTLWLIGDGPELSSLKEMIANANLTNEVQVFGSKYGHEKDQLIQQMSIFIHASRNEGLPTAVLEAAGFGVPVIVTEATNLGDYVAHYEAGKVIQNESSSALVSALNSLYEKWLQNDFSELEENAKKMVDQEFNWKKVVSLFDQLYQS